jgi:hypothetical protein
MLFLQCAECGFRTVSGSLELGESRAPSRSARRYLVWRKGRVEVPS